MTHQMRGQSTSAETFVILTLTAPQLLLHLPLNRHGYLVMNGLVNEDKTVFTYSVFQIVITLLVRASGVSV